MKTQIFLVAGLLVSALSFGQTYSAPSSAGTGGTNNVFVGESAGINTTGNWNVFTGYRAGFNNALGKGNVFTGHQAGLNTVGDGSNGNYNVFTGYNSGLNNVSGTGNVFIGHLTGSGNTTGGGNVFIGNQAGITSTNVSFNVFIGNEAGRDNTGASNVFTGTSSGMLTGSGTGNSFYGHGSGSLALGHHNVFVGMWSGQYADGSGNVCIGRHAGRGTASAHLSNENVLVGSYAGLNATGISNVMLGSYAGSNATGNKNVFIGHSAGSNELTGNDKLYIANSNTPNPLIYGEFNNKILKFNAKVGIGTDFGDFPLTNADSLNLSNYKLYVRGGILAEEVRIRLHNTWPWPDYVFAKDYKLRTLPELEEFINENRHLPNVPSAAQVEKEGIELGNMVKVQQEKIEELTLYLIEQNKQIETLKAQNMKLEAAVEKIINENSKQ